MNVILLGPPGCGKGTQSKKISEKLGLIHISTGDILREKKLNLGNGDLVSDEIVIELVKEKIKDNKGKGLLFDGFPRTAAQAKALDDMITIHKIIYLNVSREETEKRIIERGKTSERADDKKEIANKRFDIFEKEVEEITKFYRTKTKTYENYKKLLTVVDGEDGVDNITSIILNILNDHGWDGLCCCNCQHQKKIMCHPWNKSFGKGSISKQCGWGCAAQMDIEPINGGEIVFSDSEHGFCELHAKRRWTSTNREFIKPIRNRKK